MTSAGNLLVAHPESIMSLQPPLAAELEAKAQELVARLRPQAEEDLLALARLLVSKEDSELFEVRAIVHRLGAKAYATHLTGKKTATRVPASSARSASKAPSSSATATKLL
jgi:hypothetical protein